MTTGQALAFAVIGGMMAMFVWNRLRYDLVALLGLLIAVACGVVPVEEAFSGFSDPADDILVLQGDPHTLRTIVEEGRLDLGGEPRKDERRDNVGVVEAVVMRNSPLVGCASTELRLRDRHGVSLIAISRQGQAITTHLRDVRFHAGDVLVLQGDLDDMPETLKNLDCLPLVDRATGLGRRRQELLPLILVALAMVSVALNAGRDVTPAQPG